MLALGFQANLQEQVQAVDKQGTATIRLQYDRMVAKISRNGQPPPNNPLQQVAPLLNLLSANMRVDRQGAILLNQPDTSKLPQNQAVRQILGNVGDQIQHLLQAVTVPLAGAMVQPGQSWTAQRLLPIDTAGKYDGCVIDCKYTYLASVAGTANREAVIDIQGDVKPRPGSGAQATGTTSGTAIVDLASGLVSTVEATVEVDLNVPVNDSQFRAGGTLALKLQRGP